MNLFEKLNRLDDKLVESKRVVDTKRLTESFEHDDDIDEMLTESEENYELATLVKDSINHLVNDLGKDPVADDFGDDVCADLENNYDVDVPQNPVKYADWCDAVMSEVSRQLNNKEEQLTEDVVSTTDFESIANQIIAYTQEHPTEMQLSDNVYDYINDLNERGVWNIPAEADGFKVEDPENITEEEAEAFINMLVDTTDLNLRLKFM